jgi:hypothetical protein
VVALRIGYILGITAVFTLLLNLLLTRYLIKDKIYRSTLECNNKDVVNFVLTPAVKMENAADTEILATEIMPNGDN